MKTIAMVCRISKPSIPCFIHSMSSLAIFTPSSTQWTSANPVTCLPSTRVETFTSHVYNTNFRCFHQPQKWRSSNPRVYGIKEREKLADFWNEKMSDKKRLSIMNVHLQLTKNYSEDSKIVFDIALCIFMMMVHKHRPYFPHNFHIKSPSILLIE